MFSIIIPVHNSEKTVRECLNSLIKQTFDDFEVILVENGSIDSSLKICREYESTDRRFKAYDIGKCNGPSKARNHGLEKAQGNVVVFLDSDDYLGSKVLEMLEETFREEHTDIVFYGYCHEKEHLITESVFPKTNADEKRKICLELHRQNCFGYVCCKAYKKQILDDVRFDEELNLFEDEIFTLSAVEKAATISAVSKKYVGEDYFYHIRDSEQSLMSKTHFDIIYKKEKEYAAWEKFLGEDYENILIEMATAAVKYCRWYIFEHDFDIREAYFEMLKTTFFRKSKYKPNYIEFRVDHLKWRIKVKLR